MSNWLVLPQIDCKHAHLAVECSQQVLEFLEVGETSLMTSKALFEAADSFESLDLYANGVSFVKLVRPKEKKGKAVANLRGNDFWVWSEDAVTARAIDNIEGQVTFRFYKTVSMVNFAAKSADRVPQYLNYTSFNGLLQITDLVRQTFEQQSDNPVTKP